MSNLKDTELGRANFDSLKKPYTIPAQEYERAVNGSKATHIIGIGIIVAFIGLGFVALSHEQASCNAVAKTGAAEVADMIANAASTPTTPEQVVFKMLAAQHAASMACDPAYAKREAETNAQIEAMRHAMAASIEEQFKQVTPPPSCETFPSGRQVCK
jgi:hypothetical protein